MVSNYVHGVTLPTGVSVSQSLLLHRCTGRRAPDPRAGGTSDGRERKQQYFPFSKNLLLEVQHLGNPQVFFRRPQAQEDHSGGCRTKNWLPFPVLIPQDPPFPKSTNTHQVFFPVCLAMWSTGIAEVLKAR